MSEHTERTISRYAILPALMRRDPLAREIGRLFLQLHTEPLSDQRRAELEATLDQHRTTLCQKYCAPSIELPDAQLIDEMKEDSKRELAEEYPDLMKWSRAKRQKLLDDRLQSWANTAWSVRGSYSVFTHKTNWIPPSGEMQLTWEPDGTLRHQWVEGRPPPAGQPPTLQLTVNLTLAHFMGVTHLTEAIKQLVQQKLQELPRDWQPFPKELDFLRTQDVEDFLKDLRRYDWHMDLRLSFRRIAQLESQEAAGEPIPSHPTPAKVGKPILGEDGVERAVKRIYRAIHRTAYRARRRR